MIKSVILQTTARVLVPLMLLFSVFIFFRGHNESGGGFIGGLLVVGSIAMYALAYGVTETARTMRVKPPDLIAAGVFCATAAGVIALLVGDTFLTGVWVDIPLPGGEVYALGSALLFDLGVYFGVSGAGMAILFSLESQGKKMLPN